MIFVYTPLKESSWHSCVAITRNLIEAYKTSYSTQVMVHQFEELTLQEMETTVKSLKLLKCKTIVLLDHDQRYLGFMCYLAKFEKQLASKLNFVIHLYGDFAISASTWKGVEKYLIGLKINFVCASHKQVELVKSLVEDSSIVGLQPFLVDTKLFHHQKAKVTNTFLYVGRISTAKNVELLCEYFVEYQIKKGSNDKLIICGEFDDIGSPYFGFNPMSGFSMSNFTHNILENPKIAKYIDFRGFVSVEELRILLGQAKAILSLSTYHDEDFGMAIAESLMTGTPAVLSDWAGYSSFKIDPELVQLVPVKIRDSSFLIERKDFFKAMDTVLVSSSDQAKRKMLAQTAHENFSLLGQELKKLMEVSLKPFEGFSLTFSYLSKANCKFDLKEGLVDYKKIYGCYFTHD